MSTPVNTTNDSKNAPSVGWPMPVAMMATPTISSPASSSPTAALPDMRKWLIPFIIAVVVLGILLAFLFSSPTTGGATAKFVGGVLGARSRGSCR